MKQAIIVGQMADKTEERIVSGKPKEGDVVLDKSLRPKRLSEYIGQDKVKENVKIAIEATKGRKEALDHVLIYGPPGLGKTTLAHIIAAELGASIRITSGPAIERPGDLAAIISNLREGDILFIDEVHRLPRIVEEVLYPAMEDFALDIVIGKGPGAKSLRLHLPRFTLIGATTRYAMLSPPLRDWFGAIYRLDFYDRQAMETIVQRSASILNVPTEDAGVKEIACRARRTPRVANRLLRRVRDYARLTLTSGIRWANSRQPCSSSIARRMLPSTNSVSSLALFNAGPPVHQSRQPKVAACRPVPIPPLPIADMSAEKTGCAILRISRASIIM